MWYPPIQSGQTQPTPTRMAYNTAAKKMPPTSQPPPPKQSAKPPQNPKSSYHPSRLVVQFRPNGIPAEHRPDPGDIVSNINTTLELNPQAKHMKVVAANFNNQGNLILSICSDQTSEELLKFQTSFSPVLTNMCDMQEIIICEDRKWFKVQIDGISTGSMTVGNSCIHHNTDMVLAELLTCNPIYADAQVAMTAKPRWLRMDEELTSTLKSSLVFALTNETIAHQILNQKSLAAFGRHCTVWAFQDHPPVTQC